MHLSAYLQSQTLVDAAQMPWWVWVILFSTALLAIFWWWVVLRPQQDTEINNYPIGHGAHSEEHGGQKDTDAEH